MQILLLSSLLLSLLNVIFAGLTNLGMVSLKGSLGIGLRPKGEHSGPLISTYYGHGLGPGSGSSSAPAKSASSSGSNFVTSCCKGKLKLFGQSLFGHGHFKGQYVKGPSTYKASSPLVVNNYHHLHNQHEESYDKPVGGLGVVSTSTNDINDDDYPVKLKDYNSYNHRQYPKQEQGGGQSYASGYSNEYNYPKFKTPAPVQQPAYHGQDNHDSPPFWGGNAENGAKSPIIIDGKNQNHHSHSGEDQFHHNQDNRYNQDNRGHGPPPNSVNSFGPPPPSNQDDNRGYHHPPRYPSLQDHQNNAVGEGPNHNNNRPYHQNQNHPDYSETDGVYHSHPNSAPPSFSFSNSIYDHNHNHDDKPRGGGGSDFLSSPSGYKRGKKIFDIPPYGGSGPSRDYGPSKSAPPPMQVIDHHHPHPGPYPSFGPGPNSGPGLNSGHYDEGSIHDRVPREQSPGQLGPRDQGPRDQGPGPSHVEQDTKYPIFPSYPPPPQRKRRIRNGYTTPKFLPIPNSPPMQVRSSLLPTEPMIPMSQDSSSWMPFMGQFGFKDQDQDQGQNKNKNREGTESTKPKTTSLKKDGDLKYRVYEYGKNEVIVIDGALQPHESDLVRAHVYSKDVGKLLRTIEIKDAIGDSSGSSSSNTVVWVNPRVVTISSKEHVEEEDKDQGLLRQKAKISSTTQMTTTTTTSTHEPITEPTSTSTAGVEIVKDVIGSGSSSISKMVNPRLGMISKEQEDRSKDPGLMRQKTKISFRKDKPATSTTQVTPMTSTPVTEPTSMSSTSTSTSTASGVENVDEIVSSTTEESPKFIAL